MAQRGQEYEVNTLGGGLPGATRLATESKLIPGSSRGKRDRKSYRGTERKRSDQVTGYRVLRVWNGAIDLEGGGQKKRENFD